MKRRGEEEGERVRRQEQEGGDAVRGPLSLHYRVQPWVFSASTTGRKWPDSVLAQRKARLSGEALNVTARSEGLYARSYRAGPPGVPGCDGKR